MNKFHATQQSSQFKQNLSKYMNNLDKQMNVGILSQLTVEWMLSEQSLAFAYEQSLLKATHNVMIFVENGNFFGIAVGDQWEHNFLLERIFQNLGSDILLTALIYYVLRMMNQWQTQHVFVSYSSDKLHLHRRIKYKHP